MEYKITIMTVSYTHLAATLPTIGTLTISRLVRLKFSSTISIARGLVGSRRI